MQARTRSHHSSSLPFDLDTQVSLPVRVDAISPVPRPNCNPSSLQSRGLESYRINAILVSVPDWFRASDSGVKSRLDLTV
jgi:hypothetical protein